MDEEEELNRIEEEALRDTNEDDEVMREHDLMLEEEEEEMEVEEEEMEVDAASNELRDGHLSTTDEWTMTLAEESALKRIEEEALGKMRHDEELCRNQAVMREGGEEDDQEAEMEMLNVLRAIEEEEKPVQ